MSRLTTPPIHSLTLDCPACGERSIHRILHTTTYRPGAVLSGVARCSRCRLSHTFEVENRERKVKVIISEHALSRTVVASIPLGRTLAVGEVMEVEGKKMRILRLETRTEPSAPSAEAAVLKAIWGRLDGPKRVKVSLVRGSTSIPFIVDIPSEKLLTVGGRLRMGGQPLVIYAIRIPRRTLEEPGMGAPASQVQRVYVRVRRTPPPGSRD